MLLRLFRAKVGHGAQIMPSVKIWAPWNLVLGDCATLSHGVDLYSVDRIEIGAHATISQRAFICTASHNIDHPNMPLVTAPVRICEGAWICAEAYVHPGVTVGVDAVAGVRSVVLHDVPARQVVGGNPARILRERKIESHA
jgi:putative colanic acid biosynthesis acetyltransferase WcaF